MFPERLLSIKDDSISKKGMIFDLPMRVALCGASGMGKTSILGSLCLLNSFYSKDFKGKDIYIISPSLPTDFKLKTIIKEKDIPEENLYLDFDEAGQSMNRIRVVREPRRLLLSSRRSKL